MTHTPEFHRQLGDGPDFRPLLKQIQTSGESHIILDVGLDKIITLLRQASEVKMMEEYQSYIITSLDSHTLDFEELKFMRANITGMRLIDPFSHNLMNGTPTLDFSHFSHSNLVLLRDSDSRLGARRASESAILSNRARARENGNCPVSW